MTSRDLHRVFIGFGANLADAPSALRSAARALHDTPDVLWLQGSTLWTSAPIDATGPDFFNAVAMIDTPRAPRDLLAVLHAIEHAHGRVRSERNAPRTLDLDMLLFDRLTLASRDLTLPHPRMHARRFVLAPLAQIAPALSIPGQGLLSTLLQATHDQVAADTGLPLLMPD